VPSRRKSQGDRPSAGLPRLHKSREDSLRDLRVDRPSQKTTSRAASFLRSLTDPELDRSSIHGIAGREMSVGQFIRAFSKHMRDHLVTMKTTVAR
jgi:hypothetical protein